MPYDMKDLPYRRPLFRKTKLTGSLLPSFSAFFITEGLVHFRTAFFKLQNEFPVLPVLSVRGKENITGCHQARRAASKDSLFI